MSKRIIILLILIGMWVGTAHALRINRPLKLNHPLTEEQVSQMNKYFEEIWILQKGLYELDVVSTTKTNAKNGEIWISTGVASCIEWKAGGNLYSACGTVGSGNVMPGGVDTNVQYNDVGIFGGDSGFTFAEATDAVNINGNLTVDTNTLFVNSSTDRVGIGLLTPNEQLEITKNFRLPVTTSSSLGVIMKGGERFIHDWGTVGATNHNTFVGYDAGNFTNTNGENNTCMGNEACLGLATGSSGNSCVGVGCLETSGEHYDNSCLGDACLFSSTTADDNSCVGEECLFDVTTGDQNTVIGGNRSGTAFTTGSRNTCLGSDSCNNTLITPNNISESICIGYNCEVAASNNMILGGTGGDSVKVAIGKTTAQTELDVVGGVQISTGLIVDVNTFFVDSVNNKVAVGTTSPLTEVDVRGGLRVTTGLIVGVSTGCIMGRDSDDAGWTECDFLNGVLSCSIDADGVCD